MSESSIRNIMKSQHKNINSIGFKRLFKDLLYTKINLTQIWYDVLNQY